MREKVYLNLKSQICALRKNQGSYQPIGVFIFGFRFGSSPPISDCLQYFFFGIAKQSLAVCDAMQAKIEYAKLGRVLAIILTFPF
jgi:hypothetical protein